MGWPILVALVLGGCSAGDATAPPGSTEPERATTSTTAPPTTTTSSTSTTTSTTVIPTTTTSPPTTTAPPTTTTAPPAEAATPAVACQQRPPATEEIIVRDVDPATGSFSYDLGGGWVWAFDTEECITSTEFALRSIPLIDGYCIQVAPKSSNPGYDIGAEPAAPLKGITGSAGDC